MYRIVKRGIDIVASAAALVVISPVLLVLCVMIPIDSPGAPIFAQKRIGREGKPFTVYKLRTMRKSAPRSVATEALSDAGAHITRLGAFLRRSSLDELPQLVNILKGDMSLVGPRPLVPEEEHVHRERMEKGVYKMKPGITGWAQVNGRDQVHSGMKANLDAYYAENVCFVLDMRIIFKTAHYVITGRGIQEGSKPPAAAGEELTNAQTDDH